MKKPPANAFAFWCAATVLLGAFLLFQVQPVISKMILPWFGGSPAVWTTCLLFFQTALLAGYAYADGLSRLRRPAVQASVHIGLAAVAVLLLWTLLPIPPGASWKPTGDEQPTLRILCLLTASVGLPYFLLAGTSPLLQAWFARVYPGRSPYRLYALSNAGSLAALVSYPFLVEPKLTTAEQGGLWSTLFVLYGALCAWLAIRLRRDGLRPTEETASGGRQPPGAAAKGRLPRNQPGANAPRSPSPMQGAENVGLDAPTRRSYFVWFLLPGFASVQLLAVTNHLCQNVAVVPFLWIAPLTLYLLSFIICFDRESWYLRRFFGFGACLCILSATYLALSGYMADFWERLGFGERGWLLTHNVLIEISVYLALLFSVCMVCHGELVRRKPPAQRLTAFYLTISAGGAVGGLLVAVVCPLVFSSYVELHLALIAGFVLAASVVLWDLTAGGFTGRSRLVPGTLVTAMTLLLGVVAWGQWQIWDHERGLTRVRDFYGVLSVKERFPNDPDLHGLALYHGNTLHGFDHLAEAKRGMPTSYYTEGSGVGRTFAALRQRGPLRVGLVGLGAGTLAAYGQAGDYFRFYEIDPQVVALAKKYFTFLTRSPAKVDIVLGDARLSLEREEPQQFDVLVLDAFSGDTIPVHLLTAEAFEIYFRHLKPDGVIAAHISSRYVDLTPVIKSVERHFRYPAVVMSVMEQKGNSVAPSVWALLTRNLLFLQHDVIQSVADTVPGDEVPLWTDQRNNLFQILRTRRAGIVSAP